MFVNSHLINFSKEFQLIATNNVFYTKSEDATAHDILLCVKDGELNKHPKEREKDIDMEWKMINIIKSPKKCLIFFEKFQRLFQIQTVVNKIEAYKLKKEVDLPSFNVPQSFTDRGDLNGLESQNKF